jgi:hypothetical protein
MTPIELLRKLMFFGPEVDDYQLVALVYQELLSAKIELQVLTKPIIIQKNSGVEIE